MHSPRRALVVAGALVALLGTATAAEAAGARAPGGTATRTVSGQAHVDSSRAAHVARSHAKVSRPESATTATGIDHPTGITAGPDGALWFTNYGNNSIGRITTSGTVTTYTASGISHPQDITVGPDGALWFTDFGGGGIGRITTSGTFTEYFPSNVDGPTAITAGPDGALWFTEEGGDGGALIGRITTSGTYTDYFQGDVVNPEGITTGPDGALWYTNEGDSTIARVSTSGTFTGPYTATGVEAPEGITVGPDGALWFTNYGNDAAGDDGVIGRITTSGIITLYGARSVTKLVASPKKSKSGQAVAFTALVGPTDGGGTVTFRYGGEAIADCSGLPLQSEPGGAYQVTCTTSSLPVGTDKVKAVYSGDVAWPGSSGTVKEVVKAA
jgi:streptogramin lyase